MERKIAGVQFDEPAFWRAGAISTVAVMAMVLVMLMT